MAPGTGKPENGSRPEEPERVLMYVPDKDLADMTDEEIDELAHAVMMDAVAAMRGRRKRP